MSIIVVMLNTGIASLHAPARPAFYEGNDGMNANFNFFSFFLKTKLKIGQSSVSWSYAHVSNSERCRLQEKLITH